jgi:flagellar basal-body rod protein FlgC
MFRAIDVSTSGLVAERSRLDVIAGNIANINSTRDEQGNLAPYQRRFVTFLAEAEQPAGAGRGVGVEYRVEVDRETQPRKVHQPGHPDADAEGNVSYPGFQLVQEFVNALSASRAYEANVAAIDLSKTMITQSLRILA